jgi:hypothetical protein
MLLGSFSTTFVASIPSKQTKAVVACATTALVFHKNDLSILAKSLSLLVTKVPGQENSIVIVEQIEKMLELLRQIETEINVGENLKQLILVSKIQANFFELGNLLLAHSDYGNLKRYFWHSVDLALKAFDWPKELPQKMWRAMLKHRLHYLWFNGFGADTWTSFDRLVKVGAFVTTIVTLLSWRDSIKQFCFSDKYNDYNALEKLGLFSKYLFVGKDLKNKAVTIKPATEKLDTDNGLSFL